MNEQENQETNLPVPALRRFPLYLKRITECVERDEEYISGALLADVLGLDRVLVRKDLALTGVVGTPRLGFPVKELAAAIQSVLGWDSPTAAVLVGAGNLGSALLGYNGFADYNIKIVAAFDSDPSRIGTKQHGVDILPMSALVATVRTLKAPMAILTVPNAAAQECADMLVLAGVRGIWNFSAAQLNVPDGVKVQHENLASGLAVLSHAIASH